jgi:hypothetical protein
MPSMHYNHLKKLQQLGFTEAQIKQAKFANGRSVLEFDAEMQAKTNVCGFKNKTETLYALALDDAKRENKIKEWWYESMTFVLADTAEPGANGRKQRGVRYTPDFIIQRNDDHLEAHEIKGFLRDDARVKYLCAKKEFPFIVWKMIQFKHGTWEVIL